MNDEATLPFQNMSLKHTKRFLSKEGRILLVALAAVYIAPLGRGKPLIQ